MENGGRNASADPNELRHNLISTLFFFLGKGFEARRDCGHLFLIFIFGKGTIFRLVISATYAEIWQSHSIIVFMSNYPCGPSRACFIFCFGSLYYFHYYACSDFYLCKISKKIPVLANKAPSTIIPQPPALLQIGNIIGNIKLRGIGADASLTGIYVAESDDFETLHFIFFFSFPISH